MARDRVGALLFGFAAAASGRHGLSEVLPQDGFLRFMIMSNLLLVMMLLPIKMALRWTVNMKYIIAIPEYFLNL